MKTKINVLWHMKFKIIFFIIFLSNLLLLNGCKKDKTDFDTDYIPQTVKDYFKFKEGTYWIYKDTVSGIEDCVYINKSHEGIDTMFNQDGTINYLYEYFDWRSHNYSDGYDYVIYSNQTWSQNNPTAKVFWYKTKPGDYVGEQWILIYPWEINATYFNKGTSDTVIFTNFYPNYNLNAHLYDEVLRVKFWKDKFLDKDSSNYLIAKYFGIIGSTNLKKNTSKCLTRFNIIQ